MSVQLGKCVGGGVASLPDFKTLPFLGWVLFQTHHIPGRTDSTEIQVECNNKGDLFS